MHSVIEVSHRTRCGGRLRTAGEHRLSRRLAARAGAAPEPARRAHRCNRRWIQAQKSATLIDSPSHTIEVNMRTMKLAWFSCFLIASLAVAACGDDGPGTNPGTDGGGTNPGTDGGGTNPGTDGGGTNPGTDGGGVVPGCGTTQCSNCIDDDGDGTTDGADVHCISNLDDDESSFATGIPGDNMDQKPDCFFDGNSGSGNDGCEIDICCLLGDCPTGTDCSLSQMCIDFCAPLTPVGCDCFGCCTLCEGDLCKNVLTIPGSTDGWDCDDLANLSDPVKCPECTQTDCGAAPCDEAGQNADCILCPGQSPDELPAECNMQNQCPDGRQVCSATVACPNLQYCSNGCCIDIVIE
jgi:hypothetical protein